MSFFHRCTCVRRSVDDTRQRLGARPARHHRRSPGQPPTATSESPAPTTRAPAPDSYWVCRFGASATSAGSELIPLREWINQIHCVRRGRRRKQRPNQRQRSPKSRGTRSLASTWPGRLAKRVVRPSAGRAGASQQLNSGLTKTAVCCRIRSIASDETAGERSCASGFVWATATTAAWGLKIPTDADRAKYQQQDDWKQHGTLNEQRTCAGWRTWQALTGLRFDQQRRHDRIDLLRLELRRGECVQMRSVASRR